MYCQRGDMENRIKEQPLDLFADRTSSTKWWANQYRVLLAGLAYLLLETMRRTALRGTALARSQCRSLRLRLLRIAAVVTRNTRTVMVRLSSAHRDQGVFRLLVQRLTAGYPNFPVAPPPSNPYPEPDSERRTALHNADEGRNPFQ